MEIQSKNQSQAKKQDPYLTSKQFLELQNSEKEVYQAAGFNTDQDIEFKNIFLNEDETEWLHTTVFKTKKQQQTQFENDLERQIKQSPFVLIHGYGHSNICFYQIVKQLSQERDVYSIDLPGMGLSSRKKLDVNKPEEVINYFSTKLEQWRKNIKIEKMILVGHSIGGYFAGNYAIKHQDRILNLHLISPIGCLTYSEEQNKNFEKVLVENMSFMKRRIYNNLAKPWWNNHETVESIYNKWYIPTKCILYNYTTNRLCLSGNIRDKYKQYLGQMFKMEVSTQQCLHYLFMFPKLAPFISLEEQFQKLYNNKNINFYFGDKDWMNKSGAQRIVNQKLIIGDLQIISKAGHNVQFDNGDELVKYIFQNDEKYFQLMLNKHQNN